MEFANYINIPFAERGSSHNGCNCWGLVILWKKEQMGEILPTYDEFYLDTEDRAAAELIKEVKDEPQWLPLLPGEEKEGDVILLRIKGLPWHVGVVAGKNKMLHVERGAESVIEPYNGLKWNKRIIGFYRYLPRD